MPDEDEKKMGKYKSNGIFSIRATDEWRHWVRLAALQSGCRTTAEFITLCVHEYATKHKMDPPPERWK